MNQLQRELIDQIKAHDGIVTASRYGLYTRFDQYLAFTSGSRNNKHSVNARNRFLEKFCVPYSKEEMQKVRDIKNRQLARYKQLIIKATEQNKFKSVHRLSENAMYLHEIINDQNFQLPCYYRLKKGL